MAAAYQCDRCKKFGAYDILNDSVGDGSWRFIPSANSPTLTFCGDCVEAFTDFMNAAEPQNGDVPAQI